MPNMQRTQSAMPTTEQKVGENCHDYIINHKIDSINDGSFQIPRRSMGINQRQMKGQNRSRSKSRGRRYATQNFFN